MLRWVGDVDSSDENADHFDLRSGVTYAVCIRSIEAIGEVYVCVQ